MSLFQSILRSISKGLSERASFKGNIALKISEIIKIKIEPKDFKIKDGVLSLYTHPTIKSTILFKKEEIKSKLKDGNIFINTIN